MHYSRPASCIGGSPDPLSAADDMQQMRWAIASSFSFAPFGWPPLRIQSARTPSASLSGHLPRGRHQNNRLGAFQLFPFYGAISEEIERIKIEHDFGGKPGIVSRKFKLRQQSLTLLYKNYLKCL
jgi:hypothetical protein